MVVTFELPQEVERQLRRDWNNLDQIAKESLAVEALRAGKLSLGQFAHMLGLSAYEADGFLKRRGVMLDQTDDELQRELGVLRRVVGP